MRLIFAQSLRTKQSLPWQKDVVSSFQTKEEIPIGLFAIKVVHKTAATTAQSAKRIFYAY